MNKFMIITARPLSALTEKIMKIEHTGVTVCLNNFPHNKCKFALKQYLLPRLKQTGPTPNKFADTLHAVVITRIRSLIQ